MQPVVWRLAIAIVHLSTLLASCVVGLWLSAQSVDSPPAWQAMRVYVPEDQVDAVVPRDYLTIDIDDLERLLAEESRRRAEAAVQATGIQRAVYVARWDDQLLASSASRWEIVLPGNAQPLSIGRTSVAIDEPLSAPAGSESLVRHLRYVDDTRLQLMSSVAEETLWFGFKTKTRHGDVGQQAVDLVLPRAALATLLIAVPANSVVKANLPCARTEEPAKFLPSDWPQDLLPVATADEHWYVVHLSGRENCSLSLTPAAKANQFQYRTSVASAQCDMVVQPSGLQALYRFQLNKMPSAGGIRLRIEEPLHVRSVQINGAESSRWRSINETPADEKGVAGKRSDDSPASPRSRWIEISVPDQDQGPLLLTVEAISRLPLPFDGPLPRMEIADAFVMDGRGSLTSAENVQIEDVQGQGLHLSTTSAAGYSSWQWQWTGKPPQVRTRVRPSTSQWTVRSLTRFNVQTDVIVATAHLQLSSSSVQGNEVAFKLANGWFVDSFELENAPAGISIDMRETSGRAPELCVRWEEPRSDLNVRIAINAHFPQRTEVDTLRLQSTRIAALTGADQIDVYVVETSGRFQVEIDAELLRQRIGEDELSAWQRDLLPRLSDVWIFRGTRSASLPIRLQRVRSTLDAKLRTVVTQTEKEMVISYRLVCEPISGSIDQLRLMLPIPAQKLAPTWSLAAAADGAYPPGLLVNSRATSSSAGETTFVIELSQDMAEPFQLESELRLTTKDGLDAIPLPSLPQAVTQDAVIMLPPEFTLPEGIDGLEVLPDGLCCSEGNLIKAAGSEAARVITARYDPNLVSHLRMQPPAVPAGGPWVRLALHEHWYRGGGRSQHRTAWQFALPNSRFQQFTLPEDWDFESLSVNGEMISTVEQSGGQLRVQLPEGDAVRVELISSSYTPSSWLEAINFEEPESHMPTQETRRIAWFPGTIIAHSGWPARKHVAWAERWWPHAWWRWLGVDPWHDLVSPRSSEGLTVDAFHGKGLDRNPVLALLSDSAPVGGNWWALALDPQPGHDNLWHADRSLASSLVLAIVLIAGSLVTWVCGRRLERWWLLVTLVAIALCVVPESALMPVQLIALAVAAAALVRLSFTVMSRTRPPAKSKESHPSSLVSLTRSASTLVLLTAIVAAWSSPLQAQPLSDEDARDREEIFGILIPVDSDFQMAGDYVYVPTRLSRLLSNTNQPDLKSLGVAVQAAFYTLRVSNDPVTLTSSVGEITVELTIQAMRAEAELRLPFAARELQLQRAFLDSQEIFLGPRLRHDNMLTWRAAAADRHTLRLVFRPRMIVEKDGRGILSVGIPAIPTAKLDVMGDDLRDVIVNAIGERQLESPRFLTAQLGPADRLELSWPLVISRGATVQVQSDTWLHTRGGQVLAQCQLRVRGATALPSILHIVGDNNWQPVGQDWDDCRVIASDGASAAGRPVYSVQRSDDIISDTLTIRTLLLVRPETSSTSLSIPFLTLQEAASQQRTLAISHSEAPQWKAIGTEGWLPLPSSQATTLWDKTRLSDQPTLLRVPAGTVIATLQRSPPPPAPTADESTEISLQNPETKIRYAARWSQPVAGESAIRLQLASGLRVDAAFVDALPARFTAHSIAGTDGASTSEVNVFVDGTRGGFQSVHLQLSSPARLGRPWRLARPLLVGSKIGSSVVQVFRGAELSCQLNTVDGAELRLEKAEVRPSPLLLNLHTLVGQVDLGDRFRDSPELPIEVRLARPAANRHAQAILQMRRSDQGWNALIHATIDVPDGEVSQVLLDIPSNLATSFREPVDANVPLMQWPSADSSRAILCVLPQRIGDDKADISITIRLPSAGASQSIMVPDIRLLGLSVQRPALALPQTIAGEEVRWTQVGRPLPDNWLESQGLAQLDLDGYAIYEPSVSQFQAMWHARKAEQQTAEVLLASARIMLDRSAGPSGEICYWIEPHKQTYLTVDLPETLRLIGAELATQPIAWTLANRHSARILLQPSFLPVQLKLFVRWLPGDDGSRGVAEPTLALPELDAHWSGDLLVRLESVASGPALLPAVEGSATELSADEAHQAIAHAWAETLVQAAPAAADRNAEERALWLPAWDPGRLDIADVEISIPKQFLPGDSGTAMGLNGSTLEVSGSVFWEEYARLLEVDLGESPEPEFEAADAAYGDISWFRFDGHSAPRVLTFQTADQPPAGGVLAQLGATVGVLVTSILLWNFRWARLRNRIVATAELVWPLWLVLAAVTWLVLPLAWPSLVVGMCALIVLWRRYREFSRDRQFVLSPRALR